MVLECPEKLVRLMCRSAGVDEVVKRGDALPAFDGHCPLGSLPLVMATRVPTVPAETPYVWADELQVAKWKARLGDAPEMKIGLAWAGNSRQRDNLKRSVPAVQLHPLAAVEGVRFFSLQVGEGKEQISDLGFEIVDWTDELLDFADTAALMANLDLVISVDTAVAHLAGAMGKRVWTMLRFGADWRWMLAREDSPWYPTMRLCRQTTPGDWEGVVRRVVEALRTKTAHHPVRDGEPE